MKLRVPEMLDGLIAATGAEAVEYYHHSWRTIDVVLLDMIMPEMDGVAALRQIIEADPQARKQLYGQIQAAIAADCVYTSLWWLDNVVVLRRGFEGYHPLPGGEYTSLARVRAQGGDQ